MKEKDIKMKRCNCNGIDFTCNGYLEIEACGFFCPSTINSECLAHCDDKCFNPEARKYALSHIKVKGAESEE